MITHVYGFPVYTCNIPGNSVILQDIHNFKGIKETNEWNASCLTSSEGGNGSPEKTPFASPSLKKEVLEHSKIMMNMLDVDINLNLGMGDDYWINIYKKGHSQKLHWHGDYDNGLHILFSFVYFAKYDHQKDAKLIFINPASPFGCKELEVLPPPVVTATATKMCFGDSALLEASGANTYLWNNTNIIGDSIANPTWAFPSQTTTFTVTGTDTNNCSNTATAEVIVLMEPNDKFIDTACYIIGDSIAIGKDYGPSFIYDWTIGETDYLTCEKCASQVIQIKEEQQSPISIIVEYTDTSGCFSTQDERFFDPLALR